MVLVGFGQRKIGYRRAIAGDRTLEVQCRALAAAGCVLVFEDVEVSGFGSPGLEALLAVVQPGDVLVVWRLDRLAPEFTDMLEVLSRVLLLGARVLALEDGLDSARLSSDELIVIVMALMSHRGNVEGQRAMARWRMRLEARRWFGCREDVLDIEGAGSPPEPEPTGLRLPPPAGTPRNAPGRTENGGKVPGVGLHPLFGDDHAYSLANPLRPDGPVRDDAHAERASWIRGLSGPELVLVPEGKEGRGLANWRTQR